MLHGIRMMAADSTRCLARSTTGHLQTHRDRFVHLSRIVVVVSILLVSAPAFAQDWIEYRDQSERFGVTLPGEPAIQETTYTSWRGATLPARVYTVEDGASRYSVTVVNYATDEDVTDVNGSVAYEAWRMAQERRRHHLRCLRRRGLRRRARAVHHERG